PRSMRSTLYCDDVMPNGRKSWSAARDNSDDVRRMLRYTSCSTDSNGRCCLRSVAKSDFFFVAMGFILSLALCSQSRLAVCQNERLKTGPASFSVGARDIS